MVLKGHKNDTPEYPPQSPLLKEKTPGGFFCFNFFQNKMEVHIRTVISIWGYELYNILRMENSKRVEKNSRQDIRLLGLKKFF